MPEETLPSSSNKRSYALVAILILLVVNTVIFAVAFLSLQNRLDTMEAALTEQSNKIQDLQNQLEIVDAIG